MDDDIDNLLEQGIKTAQGGGDAPAEDSRSSRAKESSRRDRRSRSREHRRDHRDQPPRERSTSQERIEKAKQRELMELTRDHRTVFVGQLTQKVRERDLEKFFGSLAKLEHVLLIRDKFTNKSKGFAYVEFSNLEDIPKVLVVNGQIPTFQSFPILIKASEAEKNFAARKDAVFSSGPTTKASASGYSHAGSGGASVCPFLLLNIPPWDCCMSWSPSPSDIVGDVALEYLFALLWS
ncbi:hypothetical protein DYB31_006014 [Aphanomyces astaci]|uniref:RRM domain-containing protein n=1 Tax=Aphanomyces astaci TaxID=112090 RepID=A0A397FCX3_APHAT|nr:hypothetical protein DYB31_006014 [Aphanomyces astaci]